jgi:hypothetical protein
MLAEEYCGPWIDCSLGATDNYATVFRFTGVKDSNEVEATVGENTYSLGYGSIKELSNGSSGESTQNILHSRGIQFSHRSRADGTFGGRQSTLIDATNVKAYAQRVNQMTEYEWMGSARPFITLLRRGPWVADNCYVFDKDDYAEYWTPDLDFLGAYMGTAYRYIGATEAAATEQIPGRTTGQMT